MKRGPLHFWSRKNQSLFDTNIKIKDIENVELSLESSAIPESGTASVRARPTVKHHSSPSFDSFQGFAVPTPKVPLLPTVNGPKTNGSIDGNQLLSGSVISVPDLVEGEIFVPPPPSMAPPPPPETFIPPPPDFMGDLNSPGLAMPAPKLPSLAPSMEEEDVYFLKPPTMAPPKPPSTSSSGSTSSIPISCTPPDKVPEHPKFAPPQPPAERQHKTYKAPPPKPIRLSSMCSLDSPPQTPVPPPSVQTPTLSTFNPQNTAKLYSVPQTSILSGYDNRDMRPKQMLLLEDSGSTTSAPVLVQVDGKAPKAATPSKPASMCVPELKDSLQITQPSQSLLPESNMEAKTGTVSGSPEIGKTLRMPHLTPPQLQKENSTEVNSESSKDRQEGSPSQSHKFSPLLDHKLRTLKSSETNKAREGTSPLALLMAAKQRDKHKSTPSLSRENSAKNNEQPCASIQPSDTSPNSFIVTPRSSSSSSLTSQETQDSPKSVSPLEQTIQITEKSSSPTLVKNPMPSNMPALSMTTLVAQSPTKSQSSQHEDNKEELNMPLLPPPPEFDDLEEIMEPPPSIPPPDPPMKKAPTPTPSPLPPPDPPMKKAPTPTPSPLPPPQTPSPPPPPKPKPPAAPKLPPPNIGVKLKPQVQTKPAAAISQPPSALSPSQATLLSILQKKMLEMDHKMTPVSEAESSSEDWGGPLSDEDNKVPVVQRTTLKSKNYPVVNKAAALDMRELEGKVLKKYQESSSNKVPTSNGLQSKHQHGMTFTVRPGTKQPITLVSKGDS